MIYKKHHVRLGLLGFGTVGQGIAEIFEMKKRKIEEKAGCTLEIAAVAVRNINKKRDISLPQEVFTTDAESIVNRDDIDVVIEVMGGIEPAKTLTMKALENGKPVITANKALLADHAQEIFAWAQKHDQPMGYEGSVAAGLPIIDIMRDGLAGNELQEVSGILNGTTNFILSQMQEEGQSYEEAFAHADSLGYLEADPSLDVDGWDAAHKLVILASIVYRRYFHLNDVDRTGISGITPERIAKAKAEGKVIKLIASARVEEGKVELRVRPEEFPKEHYLAQVSGGMNGIWVRGDCIGQSFFKGPGAGSLPTASAVMSDLISILRDPRMTGFGF